MTVSLRWLCQAVVLPATLCLGTTGSDTAVSVRDFGAKGDGRTDDTEAIRAAFAASVKQRRGGRYGKHGMYYNTFPVVVFPSGKYVVSDTIEVRVKTVRGEGTPSILQRTEGKDIFHYPSSWHGTIEGLTFLGGQMQLNLGNRNLDKGHFVIEKCKFYHSTGPAILFREGSNSTFLIVRDCIIAACRQALVSHTDWTTLRDTWISTDPKMDNMAVIVNGHGFMTLDNMLGVPRCTGIDQRWVDNYGILHCVGCRFGGEAGGFTPVVNFAKFRPQTNACAVVIDTSYLCSLANFKRQCAVYCEEIPNGIEIRNSVLAGIRPIKVDRRLDLGTYFRGARPGMLKYTLTNNYGEFADDMPKGLAEPVIPRQTDRVQLSRRETEEALKRAVAAVTGTAPSAAPAPPAGSMDITPATHKWDLADYMDGTRERNGEYLAVSEAGGDIVIMRRVEGSWPHVLIRDVEVDLDKSPVLCWRLHNAVDGAPNSHAVRVIDREDERMVLLAERGHGRESEAHNVKDALKVGGVRTLDIRFYFLGKKYIKPTADKPFSFEKSGPGDYLVLDYLRFVPE